MWCDLSLNYGLLVVIYQLVFFLAFFIFLAFSLDKNNILGPRRREKGWEKRNEKCNTSPSN